MTYELLSKLFYKDPDEFTEELAFRKNPHISVDLGFTISGNDAFYCNIPDFVTILPRIYQKSSYLDSLCQALPFVAYKFYERRCLIDEIMLTNDIEGIRSTRKEIIDVLDSEVQPAKKQRFDGLIRKYLLLLDSNSEEYSINLNTCQDIRNIYNDIVIDEVDPSNRPDGEIFRKDLAEVISGTQQVKHVGVSPEVNIITYMDKVLLLLYREEIPAIFKVAILHYMIGYIHPFYDGNGRLSRFLSSYLLKQEFNSLVALRLSYTIKNNKNDYYKAFDICNDSKNQGDITPFLIYFSNIIEQSIDSLVEKIENGIDRLNKFEQLLALKYPNKEQKRTADLLWYLIQNTLFSTERLDKAILANIMGISVNTVHHYILDLLDSGAPIEIEKEGRKFVYKLNIDKLYYYLQS